MQVWGWKETGGEKDPREKIAFATDDGEEVSTFMITSQRIFSCMLFLYIELQVDDGAQSCCCSWEA